MSLEITIRPGRPEDAADAAPLIYSSGPDFLEYIFREKARDDAMRFLEYAFASDRGELACGRHTIAEVEGKVVGTVIAYAVEDLQRFLLQGMRQVFSFYGLFAGVRVTSRALKTGKAAPSPAKGLHFIAHLGVAPEMRGRGIGARLVTELLQEGRELGRAKAGLDVAVTNPRAQALYERLGFKVVQELPSDLENEHARVPSHYRMECPL